MASPWLVTCLASLVLSAPPAAQDEAGRLSQLAEVTLLDLDGAEVGLATLAPEKGVLVLAYTGVGCPISGKYAARLTRLAREFAARGVVFVGVNANPQDAREAIAKEKQELDLGIPVLRDFRQELTRALGARTTTEVFVFDAAGELRYRGAVDDQYALGAAKPAPTQTFLVDALDAVLDGKDPATEATEAPGCKLTLLPEEELLETVTWSSDVASIVQKNCETCHRPGQVGPFSLQSYDQAKGWAEMIASVVEERRMPPWNASEEFDGHFLNERRLRSEDRAKLLKWVADGMPRGNPAEDPAPAMFADGWRIGEPDAIFQPERWMNDGSELPEEGFRVPREGTVEYQYFVTDTDYAEDRWIRAMEIRPGAADVVHHVVVGVQPPGQPFTQNTILEYLAVAVPGDTPSIFPEGYAKLLPAGSRLIFQLHYTPNGKQRTDISSIGVIFAEEPPVFEVVSEALINQGFRIPPGADDYEVRGELVMEEETGILSLFPHMHTRGKDFRYVAHYPDGTSEDLLFSEYDFNWQESYIYEDPKFMPAGTRIECIGHFDNSAGNPNNPDPTQSVTWGDQTWQEMFVGYWDKVIPLD